jgi:ATP-dependent DNA helicase RecG
VAVTFEEAQQLIALGESETQEFKRTTGQRTESAHTLVAMLHKHGGRVWFGVTPRGEPIGQDATDQTLEDLSAVYRDIEPTVYPSIERIPTLTGKELICVRVERGSMPPYSFRGNSWERSGATNQELEGEDRNRMLVERLHGSRRWENEIADGWTIDDLDHDEIARTVTIAAERGRLGEIGSASIRELVENIVYDIREHWGTDNATRGSSSSG